MSKTTIEPDNPAGLSDPKHLYENTEIESLLTKKFGDRAKVSTGAPLGNLEYNEIYTNDAIIKAITSANETNKPVLVPVNLGNGHWTGLVVTKDKEEKVHFIFNDPLANETPEQLNKIVTDYTKNQQLNLNNPVITNLKVKQQEPGDITNCGPYTVESLLAIGESVAGGVVNEEDIKKKLDAINNPEKIRDEHQQLMPIIVLAQDSIATDFILQTQQPELPSTIKVDNREEVDEITKAIREQILQKQLEILKTDKDLAENIKGTKDFRQVLNNKDIIDQIVAKPELQKALNKAEVEGYRQIHEQFKDNFKPLDWEPADNNTRIKEIKKDGQILCNLTEKTQEITLPDGQKATAREVDFPTKLEGKGPLVISLAAKNPDGTNMAAKNAVRFTAHYDENGNLIEVSCSLPIQFPSNDPNAIGCVKIDGQFYTLPVTRGKYEQMLQALDMNKAQEIEKTKEEPKIATSPPVKEAETTPELEKNGPHTIIPKPPKAPSIRPKTQLKSTPGTGHPSETPKKTLEQELAERFSKENKGLRHVDAGDLQKSLEESHGAIPATVKGKAKEFDKKGAVTPASVPISALPLRKKSQDHRII